VLGQGERPAVGGAAMLNLPSGPHSPISVGRFSFSKLGWEWQ
jgi:hypothetical protein